MEETISGAARGAGLWAASGGAGRVRPAPTTAVRDAGIRAQIFRHADPADDGRADQRQHRRHRGPGRLAGPARAWPPSATIATFHRLLAAASPSRCASWPTCTTRSRRRWPGAERVFEVIDEEPELLDAPGRHTAGDIVAGDVVFDHVDFRYVPDVPVLKDISLRPSPGRRSPWSGRPARARPPSSTC